MSCVNQRLCMLNDSKLSKMISILPILRAVVMYQMLVGPEELVLSLTTLTAGLHDHEPIDSLQACSMVQAFFSALQVSVTLGFMLD